MKVFWLKLLLKNHYFDWITVKLQPEYGLELDNKRKDNVLSMEGRFIPSEKVRNLRDRLIKFMDSHIYPIENELYKLAQSSDRWTVHPYEEKLKELAKREGLWNLFIPVCMLLFFFFFCSPFPDYLFKLLCQSYQIFMFSGRQCCSSKGNPN